MSDPVPAMDDPVPEDDLPPAATADNVVPADDLPDQPSGIARTPAGLYHFRAPDGTEHFSKTPPGPGATPYAAPTATDGMSNAAKLAAGYDTGLYDTGLGLYQLGASIGHAAHTVSDEKMAQIQESVDQEHQNNKDLLSTGWGKAGDIVGAAAPSVLMPMGGGIPSAVAGGAMLGAAQPVASGESRAQNAGLGALGGATGAAVGKVFKILGGFGIPLDRQAAVDVLTREGIPTSVAQKTAAKGAQTVERASGAISDAQSEFMAQQQPAFNRAVLRRVGVTDPKVTAAHPDVLSAAKNKITGVMDDVASRGLSVDDEMLNGLGAVEHDASLRLPDSDMGPIKAHISDILANGAKNDGELDGTFYQKIRSSLGGLSTDPRYAPFAHDMQDVLDDALNRSAPEDASRLSAARQQYRALKQIEGAVDSAGNVSVPKLMTSLMNKSNRNQSLYGKGDQSLVTLAKAARMVIPDSLGNSGTAERLLAPLTVMEGLRSGEGPLKTALKAGAAVYSGGAMGRAMRSQGVVGNMMAKGVPGVRAVSPAVQQLAPRLGFGAAESKDRDIDQTSAAIARASGGKVDADALVERLMQRWKAAKKATDAATKPLLKIPDAQIVRALDIAQEHL